MRVLTTMMIAIATTVSSGCNEKTTLGISVGTPAKTPQVQSDITALDAGQIALAEATARLLIEQQLPAGRTARAGSSWRPITVNPSFHDGHQHLLLLPVTILDSATAQPLDEQLWALWLRDGKPTAGEQIELPR